MWKVYLSMGLTLLNHRVTLQRILYDVDDDDEDDFLYLIVWCTLRPRASPLLLGIPTHFKDYSLHP